MNPDDRRGWLAFAFILWFGLGVACDKPALTICAVLLIVWLIALDLIQRSRRRVEPDPLDNGGVVLEP